MEAGARRAIGNRRRTIRRFLAVATAAALVKLAAPPPAQAATLFWDGDGTGVVAGGAGTWNTALLRWSTTSGGSTYQAWVNANADSADFAGTAAIVTMGSAISVDTITTEVGGYT